MGKRKLIIGAVAGALLGALAMQFDKDTRQYTKSSMIKLKNNTSSIVSNPTETLQNLRTTFDKINNGFAVGAENTINALDQVENTINKLVNK